VYGGLIVAAAMSDAEPEHAGDGGSPSQEERRRESKLMARTRNAGKEAVVFDDDDEGGESIAATAIHSGSLSKTWSPGAASSTQNDHERSPARGAGSDHALQADGADDNMHSLEDQKAAARSRAERIARRAANLRAIEERSDSTQGGGFGRTFGGDYGEGDTGGIQPVLTNAPGLGAPYDNVNVAISKLDHRSVLGNRDSTVDGLLDFGIQRKKHSGANDGLDLDAGSMKRRALVHSPRNQKINRALRQAEPDRDQQAASAESVLQDKETDAATLPVQTLSNPARVPEEEGVVVEEEGLDLGDADGPLGDMLHGMAKNLSNYGDRKELERELRALKAALAGGAEDGGDEDSDDAGAGASGRGGGGSGGGGGEGRHQEGPHRSPVGKAPAVAMARGDAPTDVRAPQKASPKVMRDDISSSDESGDERAPRRGHVGRRPHVYQALGLQPQAASARPALAPRKQGGAPRGSGSDDESDMRPVSPPRQAPSTAGTESLVEDAGVSGAKFVGSKTWSPQGRLPQSDLAHGPEDGAQGDRCVRARGRRGREDDKIRDETRLPSFAFPT